MSADDKAEVLDPMPQIIQLGDPDAIPTTFQIRDDDGEDITPAVLGRLITAAGQLAGSAGKEGRDDAIAVGQQLHEAGGLPLMQAASYRVKEACGAEAFATLQFVWDGVGDWVV